jgi:uncharacterized protein
MVIRELTTDGRCPLWSKAELEAPGGPRAPGWARSAYSSVVEKLRDPSFPCFYATLAERRGQLIYSFTNTATHKSDVEHSYNAIRMFLDRLCHLPQAVADMTALMLIVRPATHHLSLECYASEAWMLLTHLHHRDTVPWPPELPTDLDDPRWSYALHGVPLFVNVSTPANLIRKSRNVGPSLVFIISPRDVFGRIAGPNEKGDRIRESIRTRSAEYDGIPAPPWTTRYGEGSLGSERKQYLLPEDNNLPIDLVLSPKERKA